MERYDSRVAVGSADECWEWTGGKTSSGYGHLGYKGKMVYAHRIAAAQRFGMFDKRLHVLHRCDNPGCVNPGHLRLGTHLDNVRDMWEKGRGRNQFSGVTSCAAGHEFTEANTYVTPRGTRQCKECRNRHLKKYRAKKKEGSGSLA